MSDCRAWPPTGLHATDWAAQRPNPLASPKSVAPRCLPEPRQFYAVLCPLPSAWQVEMELRLTVFSTDSRLQGTIEPTQPQPKDGPWGCGGRIWDHRRRHNGAFHRGGRTANGWQMGWDGKLDGDGNQVRTPAKYIGTSEEQMPSEDFSSTASSRYRDDFLPTL